MRFIFWQNIISPHQMPYISNLALKENVEKVYLIVEKEQDIERVSMGWSLDGSSTNLIEVLVSPNSKTIHNFYQSSTFQTYHFFSGIRAFPFVYNAFKISLHYKLHRGIIVEHPYIFRKPLFLHFFRTLMFDYKYYGHIEHVFAFGEKAAEWYKLWNKKWHVHEFAYCVEKPNFEEYIKPGKTRIVYVGSLIPRKNIKLILQSLKEIQTGLYHITIIGDGPLKEDLISYSNDIGINHEITFRGSMSMNDIKKELSNYDILILPSFFDGWGAVVNEALMAGLFVLVSDKCGSKSLINEKNGRIFSIANDTNCLRNHLKWTIEHIEMIRAEKTEREKMSENFDKKHIAKYFIDCLDTASQINPPWKIPN
jgi:glycosyltransferase involved in cell wall biosynthesis